MGLKERIIDVFERRVRELTHITNTSELPQWTDADVIAADCLLKQYGSLTSGSDESWNCYYCGAYHFYDIWRECQYCGGKRIKD